MVADGLLFCPFVGKMGQEHIAALHTPEELADRMNDILII